jgi:hypothetical protein
MKTFRGIRLAAGVMAAALTLSLPAAFAQDAHDHDTKVGTPNSELYVNPRSDNSDPRVGLKAGLYDAGEAALSLQHVTTLHKPGPFAPDESKIEAWESAPAPVRGGPPPATPPMPAPFGTTNSDLAFKGKYVFVGNYFGVNTYDISDPLAPKLVTSMVCPGGQGDVSVYGNLMFMSVEAVNGRMDCGTEGFASIPAVVNNPLAAIPATGAAPAAALAGPPAPRQAPPPPPAEEQRVRGIRIFDISDVLHPKQITDVQTCRGSHTHTVVEDPKDKSNVYVYISGSAGVRDTKELPGCTGGNLDVDPNSVLFTIVVVKVPLAHPEQAKVVGSPRVFADPSNGDLSAAWKGGNHGEGTQTTSASRGCHDITIFAAVGLAAGACSGNGILLDISDVANPKRVDIVSDPNYAFWHSANFSNDGKTVLFTDEWGGGGQARCRDVDPMRWGADAIFKLEGRKLILQSYYKMPAPQTEGENCVAHNGSIVPIPGRNILVQSWYQGGVSMVDFTDPTHPFEIGYFDRGPIDGKKHAGGGQWSTYYYNGAIYGSEMVRGLDVLKLVPSKFITQNEIDAAAQVKLDLLNVQNEPKVTWPATYITAKAYLDQLGRGESLPAAQIAEMKALVDTASTDKKSASKLKSMAGKLDKAAATAKTPADATRLKGLSEIFSKGGSSAPLMAGM